MKQIFRPHVVARIGFGGGTPEARELKDTFSKYGYFVISPDYERGLSTASGNWNLDVTDVVTKKLKREIKSKSNIFLDMDMSSWKNRLWLMSKTFMTADVEYRQVNTSKEDVLAWLNLATDTELEWCLPWYFENHNALQFQQYSSGPKRGRAVAKHEIERYAYWRN